MALDLLKNANIAAGGVLPMCQDTGTAIVFGKKGQRVWVEGDEEEALLLRRAPHLHRDQPALFADGAAVDVRGGATPATTCRSQFAIMAAPGEHHADEFHLMFVLKGGGRPTRPSCTSRPARC